MNVRLDRREHLGFEQHPAQIQTFERILLHHAHYRRRKIFADVAEPARDARRGASQTALAVGVVKRGERPIHRQIGASQVASRAVVLIAAQNQPPAAQAFVYSCHV